MGQDGETRKCRLRVIKLKESQTIQHQNRRTSTLTIEYGIGSYKCNRNETSCHVMIKGLNLTNSITNRNSNVISSQILTQVWKFSPLIEISARKLRKLIERKTRILKLLPNSLAVTLTVIHIRAGDKSCM